MKKIPLAFGLAVLLAVLAVPAAGQHLIMPRDASPAADDLVERIDSYLSGIYKPGEPGAAVLVRKGDRVILRKGYGMADLELGVSMEPDMVFRLGSITKQFTAAGILRLAELGMLSVSDGISKYLPGSPAGWKNVTIEHLLTHTSGLVSYTDLPEWLPLWRKDMSLDELIALFKDKPAEFEPGARWKYCNSGYILLGAIIESVTGMAYADFLKQEIFEPLGLTHSFYGGATPVIPRRIPGYQVGNNGFENAPYLSMTQPYAAGALLSSVDDMDAWVESLLAGRLLKAESLEKAFTPHVLANGRPTGYGYGWFISRHNGRRIIEHGGGINGFIAAMLFAPEDKVNVILLTNAVAPGRNPEEEAFHIATLALGEPAAEPVPVALGAQILEPLVGVYVGDDGEDLYVTREGDRLFAQRSGGARNELFPLSADAFFFKDSTRRVAVRRMAKGRVEALEVTERIGPVEAYARTNRPLPAPRKEIKLDPALYDRLTGVYELSPDFTITVTKEDGRLMALATGQAKVELFPESATEFFLKVVDARVVFTLDAAGKAAGLTLHQGGQSLPGKKIR